MENKKKEKKEEKTKTHPNAKFLPIFPEFESERPHPKAYDVSLKSYDPTC